MITVPTAKVMNSIRYGVFSLYRQSISSVWYENVHMIIILQTQLQVLFKHNYLQMHTLESTNKPVT
ncbi:hypothetical protein KSF78_0006299 [Schistosoma japonicum]|nr:hypothetical protein KSF78_0006299 [Schistosoma japonicum]